MCCTCSETSPAHQACFERALRIDENVFGADHLTVGHHVSSLGGVYFALGERALARAFGERTLAIYVRVLGEPHPETLRMRQSLALLDR